MSVEAPSGASRNRHVDDAYAVPFSTGTAHPASAVPALACDAHVHVFDGRYPMVAGDTRVLPDATVGDYRRLQARLGTRRVVLVQPSTYGVDNACLLEALRTLGSEARGIAVVDPSVDDAELERLHAAGVRGIRFNIARGGVTNIEMIEPLARRIATLGWHVQIHMHADDLVSAAGIFARLPVPVVFDHMGRIPAGAGAMHPAFAVIERLLRDDRAWVKLSGAYLVSTRGDPGDTETGALAAAFVRVRPDRLVWGSDWPHPSATVKPDDAALLDLLTRWVREDVSIAHRILLDNPQHLYQFEP